MIIQTLLESFDENGIGFFGAVVDRFAQEFGGEDEFLLRGKRAQSRNCFRNHA